MSRRVTAYVGLGSNLDEPAEQLRAALVALRQLPETRLVAESALYGNPPMGPQDQPDYVNAVAALETGLDARALLAELQAIERARGRVRDGKRWGPRVLDLDLLLYGAEVIAVEGLTVPHPGIAERAFVLVPLAEIAPGLTLPTLGPLDALLAAVDRSSVVPLATATA
ncbi:MAG: 2-amino-4-hydroxy-6-hydroxymethyldihydropteridine diphosphokinase [Gammaproteobacteria bacterium]